jgi:hypothetical protein
MKQARDEAILIILLSIYDLCIFAFGDSLFGLSYVFDYPPPLP